MFTDEQEAQKLELLKFEGSPIKRLRFIERFHEKVNRKPFLMMIYQLQVEKKRVVNCHWEGVLLMKVEVLPWS